MTNDIITTLCSIGGTALALIGKELIKWALLAIKNEERKLQRHQKKITKLSTKIQQRNEKISNGT